MPKGVEHDDIEDQFGDEFYPYDSVMPKGVEHLRWMFRSRRSPGSIPSRGTHDLLFNWSCLATDELGI
jgi:hypothetical protein